MYRSIEVCLCMTEVLFGH